MSSRTGVVLAGGKSRRFGRPKAFETHEGSYFYERSEHALLPWTDQVVIQTSLELQPLFPGGKVYTDTEKWRGEGPLAGLYTAMKREESEHFILLPCDVPFLTSEVIGEMIVWKEENGITAPCALKGNGRLHPLISIWEAKDTEEINYLLEQGERSAHRVFLNLGGVSVEAAALKGVTGKHLCNVNTEDEYKKGSLL
ncbi:molybdenum cofactor guanylyltransferase [Salimicrobium jeotgali]|uniref:molybdenum cofactor guanylyltransferase n=1 Tax=Salimicrobium jeotgali TaxID=1230341 RepID=UPI000C81FF19|nr:molybdenum cofactor guanylyltransferase [Salimicrobium jeotgali]